MLLTVRTLMIASIIVSLLPRSVISAQQRFAQDQPDISGDSDGRHAWMTAVYRDLIVRKLTNPTRGTVSIDLRYRFDAVTLSAQADGIVTIRRGKRTVVADSPESLEASRLLLAGSEAVRKLLDVERVMTVRAVPDAALLATVEFVQAVAGDTENPARSLGQLLGGRTWVRSNKRNHCAMHYAATVIGRIEHLEACAGDEFSVSSLACRS